MFEWPQAFAVVGSVTTVTLALLRLLTHKPRDNKIPVIENDIANIYERLEKLEHNVEKTNDLFIEILREDD